jgi:hypothetical protein
MTTTAKLITRDNGYFEVWQKPDGTEVRVTTEYVQWRLRHERGYRAVFHAETKARLSR